MTELVIPLTVAEGRRRTITDIQTSTGRRMKCSDAKTTAARCLRTQRSHARPASVKAPIEIEILVHAFENAPAITTLTNCGRGRFYSSTLCVILSRIRSQEYSNALEVCLRPQRMGRSLRKMLRLVVESNPRMFVLLKKGDVRRRKVRVDKSADRYTYDPGRNIPFPKQ